MAAKRGRTISTFGTLFTPVGIAGGFAIATKYLLLRLPARSVNLSVDARPSTLSLIDRDLTLTVDTRIE